MQVRLIYSLIKNKSLIKEKHSLSLTTLSEKTNSPLYKKRVTDLPDPQCGISDHVCKVILFRKFLTILCQLFWRSFYLFGRCNNQRGKL